MSSSSDVDAFGDSISDYKTALSELPRSMLFGPGGTPNPPSERLFDDDGCLMWDLISKEKLWSTYNENYFLPQICPSSSSSATLQIKRSTRSKPP